jgi:hypothetical protein
MLQSKPSSDNTDDKSEITEESSKLSTIDEDEDEDEERDTVTTYTEEDTDTIQIVHKNDNEEEKTKTLIQIDTEDVDAVMRFLQQRMKTGKVMYR